MGSPVFCEQLPDGRVLIASYEIGGYGPEDVQPITFDGAGKIFDGFR